MLSKFFGMPFWQNVVAGLLCFFIVTGGLLLAFNKSIIGFYKLIKITAESQVVTMKDGTIFYNFPDKTIIEKKDGGMMVIPGSPKFMTK